MPEHIAARQLDDISLDEKDYKADFELTEKYQGFSGELLRLSLLGIGLYGFMMAHAGSETGIGAKLIAQTLKYKEWVAVSIFMFGISSAAALGHGFFATKCLACQVQILKQLKRLECGHWSAAQEVGIRADLTKLQGKQKLVLKIGLACIMTAAVALGLGAVFVSYAFGSALFTVSK